MKSGKVSMVLMAMCLLIVAAVVPAEANSLVEATVYNDLIEPMSWNCERGQDEQASCTTAYRCSPEAGVMCEALVLVVTPWERCCDESGENCGTRYLVGEATETIVGCCTGSACVQMDKLPLEQE